jgi:TolB-like protein
MIRAISIFMLCGLLASCQSTPGVVPPVVHDLNRLASVKSIYIEDLGKEKDADLIEGSGIVREEIRTRLAQSGRFSVVQSPQEADAILEGLAGFEKWYHGMEGFYGLEGDLDTHYLGVGHFRLLDSRSKQIIWTHEYQRGLFKLHQTVTSRVAEQTVDKLLRDATRADSSL